MSNQPQGGTAHPADGHRGMRLFGLVAVAVGVLVLMAAAFVLSYTGIHAIALSAGVSPRFARIYPVIFDAMLVVACAAVLALRGAGLPSRCYAWLTMLILLAAAAGADTVHATNTKLPHKPTAAAAAIIPWVLVLLGFGLLLSMLRHARLRRAGLAGAPEREFAQPSGHVEVRQRHGLDDLFSARTVPDVPTVRYVPPAQPVPAAKPAPPAKHAPAAETVPDLAIESDPGHDDPSSDEGHPAARGAERHEQAARQEQPAGFPGNSASAFSPAPTLDLADDVRVISAPGSDKPAEAGTVPGPRRATVPVPEARPAQNAKPVPDAKEAGGPRAAGKTKPTAKAEPKTTAEAQPAPKAKPAARAKPAPKAEPQPTAAAGPGPEAVPAAGATAEAVQVPQDEPGSRSKPAAEPESTAGPGAVSDADSAPPYDPEADPLQFERVRSSPLPPNS